MTIPFFDIGHACPVQRSYIFITLISPRRILRIEPVPCATLFWVVSFSVLVLLLLDPFLAHLLGAYLTTARHLGFNNMHIDPVSTQEQQLLRMFSWDSFALAEFCFSLHFLNYFACSLRHVRFLGEIAQEA